MIVIILFLICLRVRIKQISTDAFAAISVYTFVTKLHHDLTGNISAKFNLIHSL
jgi:hypothetical protein